MTTAKSVERALEHLHEALERDTRLVQHPGVRGFLITAQTGAEAAARLLEHPDA